MSESRGFNRLHESVQRWVWKQNWTELREIQEIAIEPILRADTDVIIGASTAAGKTEAAFLPACSHIRKHSVQGIGLLYISPLKALINDQYRRLESLAEILELEITPWHGDVLVSLKNKLRKNPNGIVLITPESLESLFLNHAGWVQKAFANLKYIIVDEFHAFIGSERGCQLQSLMHRLEFLLQRKIPRIALSATLGEMQQIPRFLRPSQDFPYKIIESTGLTSDLKVQLRGYLSPLAPDETTPKAIERIIDDLFTILRGKSNLIFANSRRRTEEIAAGLADCSSLNNVPNEFFPHHGSLSKELREGLESRFQEGKLPTSAICTMTLELGIDIGSVDSIAQVTAPHSVASLRQRLGRSGRRDQSSVLRMFIPEDEIGSKSHLVDRLRIETIQCVAMMNLLLRKWYEPAHDDLYHFSTLLQQTLSVVGQYGGVRADQLWSLLCQTGPFRLINQTIFIEFLKALGEQDLITQTEDDQIIIGKTGERVVGHFAFYTAFNTPEEYRLECDGRILGTLPISYPLIGGQLIVFAGQKWEVLEVNDRDKVIRLKHARGGRPPKFGGEGQNVHETVRKEMFNIYRLKRQPVYLDKNARVSFNEGIETFHSLGLENYRVVNNGNVTQILPWQGDRVVHTIALLLRRQGLNASSFSGIVEIDNCSIDLLHHTAESIIHSAKPTPIELAETVLDTLIDKHDHFLPRSLRNLGYGQRFFDIDGAVQWIHSNLLLQGDR